MQIEALGRTWEWSQEDTKCRKVVFDWAADLEVVYKHCKQFRTCIQAGGNFGVWPCSLSSKFDWVYTFEADHALLPYLEANVAGYRNILFSCSALWSEDLHYASIHNDNPNNLGAQYVRTDPVFGEVYTRTIDNCGIDNVDLICLDIEGAEMHALQGAKETIRRFKPTIVVEDKGLSSRYGTEQGDIEKWLAKDFGYKVVARPHRDVVLTCE